MSRRWDHPFLIVAAVAALVAAVLAGAVALVEDRLEQRRRDRECARMGEVWRDGHWRGESVWVPGQCVTPPHRVAGAQRPDA